MISRFIVPFFICISVFVIVCLFGVRNSQEQSKISVVKSGKKLLNKKVPGKVSNNHNSRVPSGSRHKIEVSHQSHYEVKSSQHSNEEIDLHNSFGYDPVPVFTEEDMNEQELKFLKESEDFVREYEEEMNEFLKGEGIIEFWSDGQ